MLRLIEDAVMGRSASRFRRAQSPKAGKLQQNRPYAEVRSREHLFPDEVEALIKAARKVGRHPHRDATDHPANVQAWVAGRGTSQLEVGAGQLEAGEYSYQPAQARDVFSSANPRIRD